MRSFWIFYIKNQNLNVIFKLRLYRSIFKLTEIWEFINTFALFYLSKSFNLSFSPSLSLFDFLITLRFDFCKKALFIFVQTSQSILCTYQFSVKKWYLLCNISNTSHLYYLRLNMYFCTMAFYDWYRCHDTSNGQYDSCTLLRLVRN